MVPPRVASVIITMEPATRTLQSTGAWGRVTINAAGSSSTSAAACSSSGLKHGRATREQRLPTGCGAIPAPSTATDIVGATERPRTRQLFAKKGRASTLDAWFKLVQMHSHLG